MHVHLLHSLLVVDVAMAELSQENVILSDPLDGAVLRRIDLGVLPRSVAVLAVLLV